MYPSDQKGFSLIEILVAVGLLAFLSLAIFQTTTSSWETNARLNAESADAEAILLSLQAVENDISQIYTPILGSIPAKPDAKNEQYWSAIVRSDGFRRTRLIGSTEKISFVANNHRRVEAESPESNFQKVSYEVERNSKGTYTLYRSTDWDAFQYEENQAKKPQRVSLIENLSNAKFQFYRTSDKSWQDSWDSENIYTKEETRFPALIKLKIEAPDPTNNANPLAWEIVVKPNQQLNYLDTNARNALKQRFE